LCAFWSFGFSKARPFSCWEFFALLNWAVITNAVTVMVLSGLAVLQVGLADV
jgi:hypothetical protein